MVSLFCKLNHFIIKHNEHHQAEYYIECPYTSFFLLSDIVLSIIMFSVIMLSVNMLSFNMLSLIMLSVIMLGDVIDNY